MPPDPTEPAELLHRVRQQLILAQVRIMELEDVRDDLSPRLIQTETLLAAAQSLADEKLEQAAHLAKVCDDLQAQLQHQRHLQHLTHEALAQARASIATAEKELTEAQRTSSSLTIERDALSATVAALEVRLRETERQLGESLGVSHQRLTRLTQLDGEVRAMKSSRSWRWSSWLRSLERTLGRTKS